VTAVEVEVLVEVDGGPVGLDVDCEMDEVVVESPAPFEVQAPRKSSAANATPARLNDRKESPSPIDSRRELTGLPPFSVALPTIRCEQSAR
jgi:hypothetical protein